MADRNVTVSLKVRRDDGAAFAAVKRDAEQTAKSVERVPKALREAADWQKRVNAEADKSIERRKFSKAVDAELGRRGEGRDENGLLAGLRAFALVHGTGAGFQAGAEALRGLSNPDLSFKGMVERTGSKLPFGLGQVFDASHGFFSELTGRPGADRAALRDYERNVRPRLAYEQAASTAQTQAAGVRTGLFGGLGSETDRARKSLAEYDKAVHSAASETKINVENIAKFGAALSRQSNSLQAFGSALDRQVQAETQRLGGVKDFALQPFLEREETKRLSQKIEKGGIESLYREELNFAKAQPILQDQLRREATRLAGMDVEGQQLYQVQVKAEADTDKLAEDLERKLGSRLRDLFKEIEVTAGRAAENAFKQQQTQQLLQRRAQAAGFDQQ